MSDNHRTKPHSHGKEQNEPKQSKIEFLPALFLIAVIIFLPNGTEAGSLNALAIVIISIVLEAIPFMLVGSLEKPGQGSMLSLCRALGSDLTSASNLKAIFCDRPF